MNLEKTKGRDQDKRDAAAERRQGDELKHAKSITKELKARAQLLGQSCYTIDLRELPEEIKVVFIAANPISKDPLERMKEVPLELDEERRAIRERIWAAEYRDAIRIEPYVAA